MKPNWTYEQESILSNIFLSDLSNELGNDLHSFSSKTLAIRNEGIVLAIKQNRHFKVNDAKATRKKKNGGMS